MNLKVLNVDSCQGSILKLTSALFSSFYNHLNLFNSFSLPLPLSYSNFCSFVVTHLNTDLHRLTLHLQCWVLSKAASSIIFESLVCLDLGLNLGLPGHWRTLYSLCHCDGMRSPYIKINNQKIGMEFGLLCLMAYQPL